MSRIVFLVEERSMAEFLKVFIPREYPGVPFLCIPHEGKTDLVKSIPRKLKAWREPGARFVVIIDNDNRDCTELKDEILASCQEAGRDDTLVRIACQELESWYLGDPEALAAAFGNQGLSERLRKARFRDPDALPRPSDELARLVPAFQKVSGARSVATHIDIARNTSRSFKIFAAGIHRISDASGRPENGIFESLE
jgi:hypothetical protein